MRICSYFSMLKCAMKAMTVDSQHFLETLANKLLTKNNEPYASVISWLRIQLDPNRVRSQKTSLSL